MIDPIGCKEFAQLVGAHYTDISHAVAKGTIKVVSHGENKKGNGASIFDRGDALRIARAVECGIPWRLAASMGSRLQCFSTGVIILAPDLAISGGVR